MAVSQIIWSLDDKAKLQPAALMNEKELEDLLAEHIEILDAGWILIGRQVRTVSGKYIDLLCMDHSGDLIVVELKKELTPREVTAQAIDYASCVAELKPDEIAELYLQFTNGQMSLNKAFERKFGTPLDDNIVNKNNVKMVIVAAEMDKSTERIVGYLREKYDVKINILFFSVFALGDRRLISRAWLEDEAEDQPPAPKSARSWNGEYYVSFGNGNRRWEDAQKYGFISAGGGTWYSGTLKFLSPGDKVWVNIPRSGYVGAGIVKEEAQAAKDVAFDVGGHQLGFADIPGGEDYLYEIDNPEKCEYVVKVDWIKTVPEEQAIKELGFFGNQNTVCRPTAQRWEFTVERLKKAWNIE